MDYPEEVFPGDHLANYTIAFCLLEEHFWTFIRIMK